MTKAGRRERGCGEDDSVGDGDAGRGGNEGGGGGFDGDRGRGSRMTEASSDRVDV